MVPFWSARSKKNGRREQEARRLMLASQPRRNFVPTLIAAPTRVEAAGNLPKLIDEYVGRLNTKEERMSVAHMRSPAGWIEPGQTPEFLEYTIILKGKLVVTHKTASSKEVSFEVKAGQAVVSHPGEWIRYSTPDEATEYIAICLPAFSPATVHRDE
jgi:mannose-6-phosphate isomerase-like protein (cupin superfamily)